MELPHYAMGQWAVQYLFQHQETVPMPPMQHTIPCRLIERLSV
jgi:DNA-binding LacI/PurR family transcriptional regulator